MSQLNSKQKARIKITSDIDAFLSEGGQIQSIPRGQSGLPEKPQRLTRREVTNTIRERTIARAREQGKR